MHILPKYFLPVAAPKAAIRLSHAAVRDLGCKHIITSPIEHHAVSHTVEHLDNLDIAKVSYVKLLPNGHIDIEDLEKLIAAADEKTLVTLMHANNEIGNILDIHAVGEFCKLYSAIFHSDTVQTVGHFPFDLRNTPVHFITGAAHKFHGPKGVGILYINENVQIKPLYTAADRNAICVPAPKIFTVLLALPKHWKWQLPIMKKTVHTSVH